MNKPLILMGNRVRYLMNILNLNQSTELDCILINNNPFQCYVYKRGFNKNPEYRITKADIKQIKLIYEITGDRETALMHLLKE